MAQQQTYVLVHIVTSSDIGETHEFSEYREHEALALIKNTATILTAKYGADNVQHPDTETVAYDKPNGTHVVVYIEYPNTHEVL